MTVIRNTNEFYSDVNTVITYGIISGLLFAIIIVMGIKWKWFKHRLTFEQIPTNTNAQDQHEPKIINASFRQSCDFDSIVNITPIKTLPPVRISNATSNQPISLPRASRKSLAPPIPREPNRFAPKHGTSMHRISQHRYKSEFEPQQCASGMFKLLSTTPPATSFFAANINNSELDDSLQTNTELVAIKTNTFSDDDGQISEFKQKKKPDNSLPFPPPYEETDPMKNVETKSVLGAVRRAEAINNAKSSNKSKKNAFLYQVPTPVEVPKLKFAIESSTPMLNSDIIEKEIVNFEQSSPLHAEEIVQIHDSTDNNKQINGFQVIFGEQTTKIDEMLPNNNKSKEEKSITLKDGKIKSPKIKKVRVLKNAPKKKEILKHDNDVKLQMKDEKQEVLLKNNNARAVQFDLEEIQSVPDGQTTIETIAEIPKPKFKRRKDQVAAKENIITPIGEPPIPMPRKHSQLSSNEINSNVIEDPLAIKSSDNTNDNTWNLVAKHRSNTRAMAAATTQQTVQVHRSPNLNNSITSDHDILQLQQRQIDIITKPKTIREMKRQQMDDGRLNNDNATSTIDRNCEFKFNDKNKDEESDTEA